MYSRSKPKITIRDIAEGCNVSIQTVSRVINNRPDVSPSTREKIETFITKSGYRPNAVARSLVSRQSKTLGVIIGGLRYISVGYTLNGINEACEKAGYSLIIKELLEIDSADITPLILNMVEKQVEGIIYAAPDINDNVFNFQSRLPASCPPIIFIKSKPNPKFTTISIDNYGGACKAVEHLIANGCKHIGHISGPLSWLEARERKKGWEDTLKKHGLEQNAFSCFEGDWTGESGIELFPYLLQRYQNLDGLFVSNDEMAMGVIRYANSIGLKIPKDISVVGFDNQKEGAFFSPSITTVSHPLREMGKLATTTMISILENEEEFYQPLQIKLETSLIIRESSHSVRQT